MAGTLPSAVESKILKELLIFSIRNGNLQIYQLKEKAAEISKKINVPKKAIEDIAEEAYKEASSRNAEKFKEKHSS